MWGTFARSFVTVSSVIVKESRVGLNKGSRKYFRTCPQITSKKSVYGHEEPDRWDISSSEDRLKTNSDEKLKLDTDISGKYKVFRDEDSEIVFDVEEERRKAHEKSEVVVDEFAAISLERGVTGVFDIADLVDILKQQKAEDIVVITVPPAYCYVTLMILATGRSSRHLQAVAEFIRKVYKRRKGKYDPTLNIEGEESKNWKALDLGNIALHVFLKSTRETYDLESLWSLGAEYDNICRKPDDPLIALLKNPYGLEGLEPAPASVSQN